MGKMTLMSDNKGKNIIEIIALIIGLGVVVYLVLDIMKPKTQEPVPQPQNNSTVNENSTTGDTLKSIDDSKYLKKQTDGTYVADITLDKLQDIMNEFTNMESMWKFDKANFKYVDHEIKYNLNVKVNNKNLAVVISQKNDDRMQVNVNGQDINVSYAFDNTQYFLHMTVVDDRYLAIYADAMVGIPGGDSVQIYDSVSNKIVYKKENITINLKRENPSDQTSRYVTTQKLEDVVTSNQILVYDDGREKSGFLTSCDSSSEHVTQYSIEYKLAYSDNNELVEKEERKYVTDTSKCP